MSRRSDKVKLVNMDDGSYYDSTDNMKMRYHESGSKWPKICAVSIVVVLILLSLAVGGFFLSITTFVGYPVHASCHVTWKFKNINCSSVNAKIVDQIHTWTGDANCKKPDGTLWQKCLYHFISANEQEIKAKHETPVHHYFDDLSFLFTPLGDTDCQVKAFSTSEVWYAVLDYGTNYCNLFNLVDGSGLTSSQYLQSESTSDKICTQYSSANCDKY